MGITLAMLVSPCVAPRSAALEMPPREAIAFDWVPLRPPSAAERATIAALAGPRQIEAGHGTMGVVTGFTAKVWDSDELRRVCASKARNGVLCLVTDETTDIKLAAFDCGADDVFALVGDPRELVARIRALAHRTANTGQWIVRDRLVIELDRRCVQREGRPIALPNREYELLVYSRVIPIDPFRRTS